MVEQNLRDGQLAVGVGVGGPTPPPPWLRAWCEVVNLKIHTNVCRNIEGSLNYLSDGISLGSSVGG